MAIVLAIYPISNGYEVLGLLHILAVIAAFGPLLVYPTLQRAGADQQLARMHMRITLPALVLMWVFGMGLVGMSDEQWKMSDGWISAALVVWVAMVAVSWFLIRPAITDRSEKAKSLMAAGTGITHLLMVVGLYLMVFKPGA